MLALADVLLLAKDQHSEVKIGTYGEQLLDDLFHHQHQALSAKIPFGNDFKKEEYMAILDTITSMEEETISPRQGKLRLLALAAELDPLKSNVIEGIDDV